MVRRYCPSYEPYYGYYGSFSTIAIGVTAVLVLEFISMILSPTLLVQKVAAKVSSAARGRKRKS